MARPGSKTKYHHKLRVKAGIKRISCARAGGIIALVEDKYGFPSLMDIAKHRQNKAPKLSVIVNSASVIDGHLQVAQFACQPDGMMRVDPHLKEE